MGHPVQVYKSVKEARRFLLYLNLVSTCLPFLVPPGFVYVLYQHSLYSVGLVDIGELLIPIPRQLKFKGLGMEKIERKYARDEFG